MNHGPSPDQARDKAAFPVRGWAWPASLLVHGLILALVVTLGTSPAAKPTRPRIVLFAAMVSPGGAVAKPVPRAPVQAQAETPVIEPVTAKTEAPVPAVPLKREKEPSKPSQKNISAQKPLPSPVQAPAEPAKTEAPAQTASRPGPGGPGEGLAEPDRQTGLAGAGLAGRADETRAYYGSIISRLEQVKRYPDEARQRGGQGTVLVRFVLGRSGDLVSWRIEKGSGLEALDQEVGNMLHKAAPFPPFPQAITHDRLVLVVPVSFTLKQG